MKITKISIWNINLKSHETYYMAGNKTCDEVESVIISIDTDSGIQGWGCLLYTSPSPRDQRGSRMPSSA